jgi:hypothetical protein
MELRLLIPHPYLGLSDENTTGWGYSLLGIFGVTAGRVLEHTLLKNVSLFTHKFEAKLGQVAVQVILPTQFTCGPNQPPNQPPDLPLHLRIGKIHQGLSYLALKG